MSNCSSCGSPMAESDRFCGICGKPAADFAVSPPGPVQADKAAVVAKPSRKAIWAIAIAPAVVVLGALLFHFAPWETRQPDDEVVGQPGQPWLATETVAPEQAASESLPATPPPVAETPIEPGRWRFANSLVNVSRVDPYDTRSVWEDDDVGKTSSHERCISPGVASAPRQANFPMLPERNCRAKSFTMSDGRYSARFICEFKGDPNGSEAAVDGSYTKRNLHVMALVTRPADLGSDDPTYKPPQIVLHLQIDGEYLGSCR